VWFHQMVREETGCATYLVGSARTGECAVFDPLWDIEPCLDLSDRRESRITVVIDSHTHADHVSGARRLATATGARLLMPQLAQVTYPFSPLRHGDHVRVGEVDLEVMHVPGHRPELISLIVRDLSRSDAPWCLLTADFLLVGDLARPDLAQEGTEGAEALFTISLPRLLGLPDFVEVYPGHVAGST
jgi:hydroxyacylglutathione hydrolase